MNQREILKLIENLFSKVDNLTNVNPGQNFSTLENEIGENPNDELEEVEPARSVNSNINKLLSEERENMDETTIKHLLFLYVNAKFIE